MLTIGIDFGNINSFPCVIQNMDMQTRRGGTEVSLLPATTQYTTGIPTCYFCSPTGDERFGVEARGATPSSNQRRMLKRHLLNMPQFPSREIIGNHQVDYDNVVSRMIEYIVRKANEVMQQELGETSNEISLAYPVDFLSSEVQHLIELAERGTLADGRHIRVVGNIHEPAAAALAYLSMIPITKSEYNVVVYDLGGGTLDVASVTARLNGSSIQDGIKTYDILGQDGVKIGGHEFDSIMEEIAKEKLGTLPTGPRLVSLRYRLEEAKINLDHNAEASIDIGLDDIVITQQEFHTRARPLINRTLDVLDHVLHLQNVPTPEVIVLTGGQSQMPLIREMLLQRFKNFRPDQVVAYSPQRAIAIGAARYGVLNRSAHQQHATAQPGPVIRRNQYMIGTEVLGRGSGIGYHIEHFIQQHSIIPTPPADRKWKIFATMTDGQETMDCSVFEAKRLDPDVTNVERDFKRTIAIKHEFGRKVPIGTPMEMCVYVDELDIIHVLVRDPRNPSVVREEQTILTNFA